MLSMLLGREKSPAESAFWQAYQQESHTLLFWGCAFASMAFAFFWLADALLHQHHFFGGTLTIRFSIALLYGVLAAIAWRYRHRPPQPRWARLWMNLFCLIGIELAQLGAYMGKNVLPALDLVWGLAASTTTAIVVMFGLMKLSALNTLMLGLVGMASGIYYVSLIEGVTDSHWVRFIVHLGTAVVIGVVVRWQVEKKERLLFEAQEANASKERFLASMSHELRTPLHGILLALSGTASQVSGDLRKRLDMMAGSARELLATLNRILDYSAASSDRLRAHTEATDLARLVDKAGVLHKAMAVSKGLELRLNIEIDEDARDVDCNQAKLFEVMNNLIGNALKFTRRGFVEIEAKASRDTKSKDKVHLHFSVRDTGIGIAEVDKRHLFTAFWQAERRRVSSGTGLGLALTHEIVHKVFDGKIRIDSTQGVGTLATVELRLNAIAPASQPVAPASLPAVEAPTPVPTYFAQLTPAPQRVAALETGRSANLPMVGRILLAEDNALNALGARDHLTAIGLDVEVAADGLEAVEMFQRHDYDLVLMDLQMPNLDGIEATRRIRALEASAPQRGHTPVIAWTANHAEAVSAACRAAGMDALFAKGLDIAELPELIRGVLMQQRGPAQQAA